MMSSSSSSKNWSDKADKDLFFTILSVKNIGVISGAEWTTIGNHMRSLGYGFTNEGCRQHFQGLRRAQAKAEANGTMGESFRKVDPTLNPITRRPGPGRGRPRKSGSGQSPATPSPELPDQQAAVLPGVAPAPMGESAPQPDTLPVEPNGPETEEQPAKRPRLDENHDPALEDEAVLNALAVHGNPGPVDHYNAEYYGEA